MKHTRRSAQRDPLGTALDPEWKGTGGDMNLPRESALSATGTLGPSTAGTAASGPALLARLAFAFVRRQVETLAALRSLWRGEFPNGRNPPPDN